MNVINERWPATVLMPVYYAEAMGKNIPSRMQTLAP